MIFHLACVCVLAWPAFLNGQPFYFSDTTAYVRAADSAFHLFSGGRIATEWTPRYGAALDPGGAIADADHHVSPNGNDLATKSVMAGRSPYFGALLWLAYVIGHFWPFVLAQAAIAYWLICLTLRLFGQDRPAVIAGCVALLSVGSALPYFAGLLMPDLLAGFGILSFLLLAIERGRLSRGERWGLRALMLTSVLAHLTHIVIVVAMAVVLLLWTMVGRTTRGSHKAPAVSALLVACIGLASVAVTSVVVEQAFGRKPLLAPLLTARFMADGPGLDYLRHHCPQAGFAACVWHDRVDVEAASFLWSHDPAKGGYMFADTATRRALSVQDRAFALAVLREYPISQTWHILLNGWRQATGFGLDLLNYHCDTATPCWTSLPPRERAQLLESLGGRGLWPQHAIAIVHQAVVAGALILLVAWVAGKARRWGMPERDLLLWMVLLAVAIAVNSLLGGGASEPQARYQARVVWLLPLLATIGGMLWVRERRGDG